MMSLSGNKVEKLKYDLYEFISQPGTSKKVALDTLQSDFTLKFLDKEFSKLGIGGFKDFIKQVRGLRVDNADFVHIDKKKVKQCLKSKEANQNVSLLNIKEGGEHSEEITARAAKKDAAAKHIYQENQNPKKQETNDNDSEDSENGPPKDISKQGYLEVDAEAFLRNSCAVSSIVLNAQYPNAVDSTTTRAKHEQQVSSHEINQSNDKEQDHENVYPEYVQSKCPGNLCEQSQKLELTEETLPTSRFEHTHKNENNESDSASMEATKSQAQSAATLEPLSCVRKVAGRENVDRDDPQTGLDPAMNHLQEPKTEKICSNKILSYGFGEELDKKEDQLTQDQGQEPGKPSNLDDMSVSDSNPG